MLLPLHFSLFKVDNCEQCWCPASDLNARQTMPSSTADKSVPFWLLVLITLTGTLAMHMFVPALPDVTRSFGVSKAEMQLTVTVYIVGLAFGQLIYGPMSDGLGRRRMLLIGMAVFAVAGFAAALATGVKSLIAARLLQALGGCAGLSLGRAIVRDVAKPSEMVRDLATLNVAMVIGPGLAPLVGSWLTTWFGWRSLFVMLASIGTLVFLLIWRLLPETSQPTGKVSFSTMARDSTRLLRMSSFVGFSLTGGCATTSLYAFIVAAPFIISFQLQRPLHETGLYLGLMVLNVSSGSFITRHLSHRVAAVKILMTANLLAVSCAVVLLAIAMLGTVTMVNLMGPMFLLTLAAGASSPAALTKALEVDSNMVGSASGLYGFTQMAIGAICTVAVGLFEDPAVGSAAVLSVAMLVGQFGIWLGQGRLSSMPRKT
jgi:MFS transporter, DHA1 family, multidrug resistance protein